MSGLPPTGPTPLGFQVSLETREGDVFDGQELRVRRFEHDEALSTPYRLTLTLVTDDTALDVDSLLGARCSVDITRDGSAGSAAGDSAGFDERQIHGVVLRADYLGTHSHKMMLRLQVGPALSLLALSERSRIYQGLTAPQIVSEVVGDAFASVGRALPIERLVASYPVLDYCVQSRETDLDFVHRVLAEAGISYAWDHGGDAEALVLLDANQSMPPMGCRPADGGEGADPTECRVLTGGLGAHEEGLTTLRWTRAMQPLKHETSTWDWKMEPPTRLSASVETGSPSPWEFGESFRHDTRRMPEADAGAGPMLDPTATLVDQRRARIAAGRGRAEGRGTLLATSAGATFACTGHPNLTLERAFLITRATHRADIPAVDIFDNSDGSPHYINDFEAVPLEQEFRPARVEKPRIHGPQLATVVGPADEEIHVDRHGRVKVWMHWDREGEQIGGADTSCWMRVAQMWAGAGFGTLFLPRVGMEVVVAFLDGDPDRPLVTGCVYNAEHPPPYVLPDERTKSTLKTASSPGGVDAGFNELRFDDAAGREQIFVHAQRNLDEKVRSCQSTSVGVNQTLNVGKDRKKNVGGDETRTIDGSRTTKVGGGTLTNIAGSRVVEVGCAASGPGARPGVDETRVLGERHVYAEDLCYTEVGPAGETNLEMTPEEIVLKASKKVQIQVGNTVLTITPEKIWAATVTAHIVTTKSSLFMKDKIVLKSDQSTKVGQGPAWLLFEGNEARLQSRKTVLAAMTSPDAGLITLTDNAEITGKQVVLKPSKGDSHLRVKADEITSSSLTANHSAAGQFQIKGKPIDLN